MMKPNIIGDLLRGGSKGSCKKGQAVMEYLITYGLALFVILIVLAILVAVVLPSLRAPETCQFTQPGFTCNQRPHAVVADINNNVDLLFQLDNQQGKGVTLVSIYCTTDVPGNIMKDDAKLYGTAVSSNDAVMVPGSSKEFSLDCLDNNNDPLVLAPNSNFKGTLAVVYKYTEDITGAPERLAVATVTGTVQQE